MSKHRLDDDRVVRVTSGDLDRPSVVYTAVGVIRYLDLLRRSHEEEIATRKVRKWDNDVHTGS